MKEVDEVMQFRRARPFQPFIIELRDGRQFLVFEPERVARDVANTRITVAADEDSFESFPSTAIAVVRLLRDGDVAAIMKKGRGA
jgi:hypothetical protein